MSHQKINSTSTDFIIPRHSGHENSREVKIKLASVGKFDVYQKDLPANLPAGYDWINSFGLKHRPKDHKNPDRSLDSSDADPYPIDVEPYLIELDDVDGKEPVFFDGAKVQNFPGKKTSIGNGRVHVTLALGDPPIGWPKSS
jgi:hypothetical protein